MAFIKSDGYVANGGTGRVGPITAKVWCTEAVTAAQWIASYPTDTTSPSGLAGGVQGSFRIADGSNADALYNTVGVALETTTAAGEVQIAISGYVGTAGLKSGSTTVGADLVIHTDAGLACDVGNAATNGAAYRIIGTCLTDSGSDYGSVIVNLHPMFAGTV